MSFSIQKIYTDLLRQGFGLAGKKNSLLQGYNLTYCMGLATKTFTSTAIDQ